MKNFFAILAVLFVGVGAFADDQVIVSSRTFGGFAGPGAPTYHLTIRQSGAVEYAVINNKGVTLQKVAVARLSPEVVKGMMAQYADLQTGAMVLANPEDPMCYDAPTTTYSVLTKTGFKAIAEVEACRSLYAIEDTYVAENLKETIQTLNRLAYLAIKE